MQNRVNFSPIIAALRDRYEFGTQCASVASFLCQLT